MLFAVLASHAYDARAGEAVSNEVFSSGTSFEPLSVGSFDPHLSDEGKSLAPYFWATASTDEVASVSAYAEGEAYDYAAAGMLRNAYLEKTEPSTNNYISILTEDGLHRSIFGRSEKDDAFSNVVVRTGTRESIYCDVLAQFTSSEVSPTLDDGARIAVWMRVVESGEDGEAFTNLIVTAGYFTNDFRAVVQRDYVLEMPDGLNLADWHRLTIRAHGDVSLRGSGLSGFSVYVDGRPMVCTADTYEICDPRDSRTTPLLKPEARALQAERRFFPSLATPGTDAAFTISGFTFRGNGQLDDISFSSVDPGYARPEAVFTVSWDTGFAAPLRYSLDGGLTTNDLPVGTALSRDILIGPPVTNGLTLKVTEFALNPDPDLGFSKGVWLGQNGVTLTNETATTAEFVADGTSLNPIALLASTRETVGVGTNRTEGSYDVFRAAFAALDRSTNALKLLELQQDMTVSLTNRYGSLRDEGYVQALNPEGEYVLDLCGHTLHGANPRQATVYVACKSFRIKDSGDPAANGAKTGRIVPYESYTNASPGKSTAVEVMPRKGNDGWYVEPVLTLQGGIYDGWVRNDGCIDGTNAVTGVVFVEGGSYISTNGATFYLESCVTNPMLQYVYRRSESGDKGYWEARPETNLVIWTGLGDGRRWADPENWKIHRVPNEGETALFPSRAAGEGPWTVDLEDGQMTTKTISLEGDVFLSGTNDFIGVTVTGGGEGRICGNATLVFEGDQPGKLTETMLRDDWAGTVLVRNLGYPTTKVPKVLKSMETWGTPSSTVVFNGVRGYVMDIYSHTMTYGLVLEDLVVGSVTNAAWQNDLGYTGSTLAFTGTLTGDGTFKSGANTRPVLQLLKFADVHDFRGRFSVDGKRVLLGGETTVASVPGLLTFGDYANVASGLGWTCKRAVFGTTLFVSGATNDALVRCSAVEPDVSSCTNLFLNGVRDIAWLACTNEPAWTVYISGERPASFAVSTPAVAAAAVPDALLTMVPASLQTADGYSGAVYQSLQSAAYAQASYAVQLADVSIETDEDEVRIVVSNASRGLWYGVRFRESLAAEWSQPTAWTQATDSTVTLTCDRTGETGFYSVVVSYENPCAGGENP